MYFNNQHSQGNSVLLAGDYNEELDITYNGITKLCSDFHLIDLMFHLTGPDNFATYACGSNRIDYILCDAWVSNASLQGCYEPFQYCLKGDHHAMVVDFDMHLLFAILLPHSLHWPNENFHPKMMAPIGNISNTNTNISLNTTSTPVLPTYKKHGTPL